jgi:hypothetical protein
LTGGAATQVVSDSGIRDARIDGTFLYWTGKDGAMRQDIDGSQTPLKVADGQFVALALDAHWLYLATFDQIVRVAKP